MSSDPEEGEAETRSVPLRRRLRSDLLAAIAGGDFAGARRLGEYLVRLTPPTADDFAIAATARLCNRDHDGARHLLRQALTLDSCHVVAAKGLFNLGVVNDDVLAALSWHAETDPDVVRLLLDAVGRTGRPLVYVAARLIHCVLPPGAERLSLIWEGLVLGDHMLRRSDTAQVLSIRIPERLRGVADPAVLVDGCPVGMPVDAPLLRPPRLTALVERLEDGNWQARVIDHAAPARPVSLLLLDGERLLSRHVSIPAGGQAVGELLDAPLLTIPLPAGTVQPRLLFELTGEPLALPDDLVLPSRERAPDVVDVVVPVYGDEAATRACFAALLETDPGVAMRVIALDDAGPVPALGALLDHLAREGRILLRRNPGNLGFVRSVNIGMAISCDRDVVLLNADTVVSDGWLRRLRQAAYRTSDIGTATPWSNDATICSYPIGNDRMDLDRVNPALLDRVVAEALAGQVAPIPTAVGFCMYIRRDCLEQTGWFDPLAFGAGYGEENDFCLRAAALGWRHVLAQDVYVGHVGGGSFGPEKQARIRSALAVLEKRHPGYEADIFRFLAADPLAGARRRLDMARLNGEGGRFPLLLVCAILGGGTDRFVSTLVARRAEAGFRTLILRPERPSDGALRLRLEVPGRDDLPNLIYDPADGLTWLRADLDQLGVERMEFHHPSHLSAPLLAELAGWFPYRLHLHDYSWICPRITLTTDDGRYCGEPDVGVCETCVARHGDLLATGTTVARWRATTRTLLETADAVDCAAADSATRIARYAPGARTRIMPIEAVGSRGEAAGMGLGRAAGPIRVLIPGAIGQPKGYGVLLACARDAAARDLPLSFLVMGYSLDDGALLDTGRVYVTGLYGEEEAATLLTAMAPDVGFLPSTWPETWCYALTHLFAAGLPVAVFDLGAQAERVRSSGGTCLLLPLEADPSAINDMLIALAARPSAP